MEKYKITMGDFLKNAGIVGLKYLLDIAEAEENQDFGISENGQELWLSSEFAEKADWTDLYFRAFIQYFGPFTAYQGVQDRIDLCLEKIKNDKWKPEKREKDDLKFVNDKLLSNSYQAGYDNIKDKIEQPEIYLKLKAEKLNDKFPKEMLEERLLELKTFIEQPVCRETFIMKSIVYTHINRFWSGKCFLLRANAKKDMRQLFEKEFSEPMRTYWKTDHKKAKDLCIDCGSPMGPKEKVSIAFMNEMADDLTRKRSAFWNCKVDAFICPVCAFLYALSPLGFQLYVNKFVFINTNRNISQLLEANSKTGDADKTMERKEKQSISAWFGGILNTVINENVKELSNTQVILRGVRPEDHYYLCNIPSKALKIMAEERTITALRLLGKYPYAKIGNDFVNIHEKVVLNLIQLRNQYGLLNILLKEDLKTGNTGFSASQVYEVQHSMNLIRKREEKGEKVTMNYWSMKNCGADLRKAILKIKGANSGECLRGTVYQLINALSVKNTDKFMDIVLRLYNSYGSSEKLLIPQGFIQMLEDQDVFMDYGYAFVMGLEGCYEAKKDQENTEGGNE
ncbi:CRISPR-associated protein Cas8a1/Cst1%2C subtype I-B/TNEAP [uncultured Clostridium sp.]|nr:CRISPR-associated protein Cas8a1/Cst1%2C subtype I-B/TNEAP [uncultured Clostridium sp.]